jgi:GH24 family phage-related lysozyme (muramidase)
MGQHSLQFTLDSETQRRAQAKAAELGLSLAEYVRRVIVHDLGESRSKAHVSVVFDLGASDEPTNIVRDKDRMIGEAVWQEHVRKTGQKRARRRR